MTASEAGRPLVEMHTRPGCRYCDWAKAWFAKHGIPYTLTLHEDLDEWQAWKAANGAAGAPWIVVDGEPIGGFDKLQVSGLEHLFR